MNWNNRWYFVTWCSHVKIELEKKNVFYVRLPGASAKHGSSINMLEQTEAIFPASKEVRGKDRWLNQPIAKTRTALFFQLTIF